MAPFSTGGDIWNGDTHVVGLRRRILGRGFNSRRLHHLRVAQLVFGAAPLGANRRPAAVAFGTTPAASTMQVPCFRLFTVVHFSHCTWLLLFPSGPSSKTRKFTPRSSRCLCTWSWFPPPPPPSPHRSLVDGRSAVFGLGRRAALLPRPSSLEVPVRRAMRVNARALLRGSNARAKRSVSICRSIDSVAVRLSRMDGSSARLNDGRRLTPSPLS